MKLTRNGEVAIIYSPGYGAGWSTWAEHTERDLILFDPDIAQLILDRDSELITREEFGAQVDQIWQLKSYTSYCDHGAIQVMWIPEGSLFRVEEYDGSESVVLQHEYKWYVA
jgi:hypothetical protein